MINWKQYKLLAEIIIQFLTVGYYVSKGPDAAPYLRKATVKAQRLILELEKTYE